MVVNLKTIFQNAFYWVRVIWFDIWISVKNSQSRPDYQTYAVNDLCEVFEDAFFQISTPVATTVTATRSLTSDM